MKAKKRCLSVLLGLAMLTSPCSQVAFAHDVDVATYQADDAAESTITQISMLDETVAVQYVPQSGGVRRLAHLLYYRQH